MAFLKLRDQVGDGRRGGIAPTREGGREGGRAGGPAVWAARTPARRGGCEGGAVPPRGRARGGRGLQATRLSAEPRPGEAHVPPGGSPPPPAAAARGAGPALAARASAAGALPGMRVRFPAR